MLAAPLHRIGASADHRGFTRSKPLFVTILHHFAIPPEAEVTRKCYRFYGIVISKPAIFILGGRPVIYLPDAEGGWIPQIEKWSHVRFEYSEVDFTHEREWRVPDDIDLKKVVSYVIVWTPEEAREIREVAESAQLAHRIHGILPMCDITKML